MSDAAALLAGLLGERVEVRHLCPACGSSTHGRPWLRLGDGRRPDVSIAHADGLTHVGVAWSGRVGVDLERSDAVAPRGVRHPLDDPDADPLALWVRTEAYLKATGTGLRRAPGTVSPDEPGARWEWPAVAGFVAAACLLAPGP